MTATTCRGAFQGPLALLATAFLTQTSAAAAPDYPRATMDTVAGAKVELCDGFAAGTVEYYMRTKMQKEYATYTHATEFDTAQKEALRATALQRIHAEAASRFNRDTLYEVVDRAAYLSEFKRAPDGFEVRLPGGTDFDTSYWLANGRHDLIDPREVFGLKDVLDDPTSGADLSHSRLPHLSLSYALTPADADTLQSGTDSTTNVFIPVDEAHARQIVEYYRGVAQRRGVADFFIRIQECRQTKPGTHTIVARLLGFDLYAAQLGQALFETAPSWKRKALVGQWRSPEWQGGGPVRREPAP